MNKRNKYYLWMILLLLFLCVGCGNSNIGNTEESNHTGKVEETQETEFYVEIVDAKEVLVKTWESYAEEDRFEIMGGHFDSAVMGMPEKYDLTQVTDLVQMYCVPEAQIENLDDGATMIDLYNAGRFMASAFHVNDGANVDEVVSQMHTQIMENQWHGEKPQKLMIVKIDEQYVISVWGRESLVDKFREKLESVYQEMIVVMVEEKNF